MIQNYFVTPVGFYDLPCPTEIVNSVIEYSRNNEFYNLWDVKEPWVGQLRSAVDVHCRDYVDGLFSNYMKDAQPVNVEGKINIQYPNQMFPLHSHSHSHIACVYYLNVPENSGDLLLVDPRGDTNWTDRVDGNYSNVSYERIKPRNGLMVFFPAYLSHMVEPNSSDRIRVSLVSNYYMRRK